MHFQKSSVFEQRFQNDPFIESSFLEKLRFLSCPCGRKAKAHQNVSLISSTLLLLPTLNELLLLVLLLFSCENALVYGSVHTFAFSHDNNDSNNDNINLFKLD